MNAKSISVAVMADIMAGLNTRRSAPPSAADLPAVAMAEKPLPALSEHDGPDHEMLQLSKYKIADFSGKEDLFFRRFVTTQVSLYCCMAYDCLSIANIKYCLCI